jgi:hypothetical protein
VNIVRNTLLAFTLACIVPGTSLGQDKPIQLALLDPVQIVPAGESISGFRFSLLYGRNAGMKGFDLGLATKTTGSFKGVQWGLVGMVDGDGEGWQHNMVSITNGAFSGLQSGFFSSAGHVHGLQFSFVNNTGTIKGIQLGLINIIREGGFMPVFPIVNWGGL